MIEIKDKNGTVIYTIDATTLAEANLQGANLVGANLDGAKGFATKEEEMAKVKEMLKAIKACKSRIKMDAWHICETIHCLAGWCLPEIPLPAGAATMLIPTVAKYFYRTELTHEAAIGILERVASGEESIYNENKE